jgi:hypothetical protein
VLVDPLDRFLGNLSDARVVPLEGASILHTGRDTAKCKHGRETPDGVCTAAEAEQEDPVAWFPQRNDSGVAIDDVGRQPKACRLADQVLNFTFGRTQKAESRRQCSDAGIVVCQLLGRIDRTVGAAAAGAIQFINIAPPFIDEEAASLTGTVGKDNDVLSHLTIAHAAVFKPLS